MRIWNTVQSAQKAAIEAAVEGVKGREVDEAARKVVETNGVREVEKKGFSHRLGGCRRPEEGWKKSGCG